MWAIYAATVLCANVRSVLTKKNAVINGNPSLFNFLRALTAFILFGIIAALSGFNFHFPTIIFGVIYGFLFCGSAFCGLNAMKRGPLGITSSIVSFSLVIPCVYGAVFLKEKIGCLDIIGFVFIAVSIILMNARSKKNDAGIDSDGENNNGKNRAKFQKHWWIYVLGTIVCDGLHATIKTVHQTYYPGLYRYEFICIGMLVGSIAFACFVIKDGKIIRESEPVKTKGCVLCGSIAGIANGTYNYLVLYMAGNESATSMFPIISVAIIALGLFSGRIVFKERLSKLQILGVIAAAAAIALIKM